MSVWITRLSFIVHLVWMKDPEAFRDPKDSHCAKNIKQLRDGVQSNHDSYPNHSCEGIHDGISMSVFSWHGLLSDRWERPIVWVMSSRLRPRRDVASRLRHFGARARRVRLFIVIFLFHKGCLENSRFLLSPTGHWAVGDNKNLEFPSKASRLRLAHKHGFKRLSTKRLFGSVKFLSFDSDTFLRFCIQNRHVGLRQF